MGSRDAGPLEGRTVAVTADRRGEEQSLMFRRLGAEVVHGPALATRPAVQLEQLRTLTAAMIAEPPDYFVANTGFGVREWLALAAGWGIEEELLGALRGVRLVARGPKAQGALRSAGLEVWWRAPDEQLASVAAHLVDQGVAGRRVVFQMHGDDREPLTAAVRQAGAEVVELPVYEWTLPPDAAPALELIDRCCAGTVDVVTFTAGPAVRRLLELAAVAGRDGELLAAFDGGLPAACIGPVCAAVAHECGITGTLVPEHWRLGSMVRLVAEHLGPRST